MQTRFLYLINKLQNLSNFLTKIILTKNLDQYAGNGNLMLYPLRNQMILITYWLVLSHLFYKKTLLLCPALQSPRHIRLETPTPRCKGPQSRPSVLGVVHYHISTLFFPLLFMRR